MSLHGRVFAATDDGVSARAEPGGLATGAPADQLPFPDDGSDTVVETRVLRTVPDQAAALPGGESSLNRLLEGANGD